LRREEGLYLESNETVLLGASFLPLIEIQKRVKLFLSATTFAFLGLKLFQDFFFLSSFSLKENPLHLLADRQIQWLA
jgi:hypothetical protein